jgi:arsenate reductase (glutaredoxin)
MTRKVYYLGNCDTCQRIIKELGIGESFEYQDIKTEKITPEQLDSMKALAGSYEALFSKIARKYRELGLNTKTLTEEEYRQFILEEYTFLKRPVFLIDKQIFIGNAPKTVQAIASLLKSME